MRVNRSLPNVVLLVLASLLCCGPALAESLGTDMGTPDADWFMHESRARDTSRDKTWESESTPDPLAYVPIVAVLAIVAFLAYFTRRESKM
jgi:hypothetical protein